MKYTVVFSRKVRTGAYETMEIGFLKEYDDGLTTSSYAFKEVKEIVEAQIQAERDRLLRNSPPRQEGDRA